MPKTTEATAGKLTTDPDLNGRPTPKLLDIDWAKVRLTSEADAIALWKRIAPTGEDWEAKLDEIPADGKLASQLAIALLHEGSFTCAPATPPTLSSTTCAQPAIDVEPPLPSMTYADPCLRRMLALWAIGSLDDDDLPQVNDALKAIAAIPPPESQLVAAALDVYPEDAHDARLELRAIAFAAGHRELVNGKMSTFDEPHLVDAAQKHHIEGALDLLSAETHRAVFLAAVADETMSASVRSAAMTELVNASESEGGKKLPLDLHQTIVAATRSADCAVAAKAARMLVQHGEKKFAPIRPRVLKEKTPRNAPTVRLGHTARMLRAMCVLASYEHLQESDEPSYLPGYIPKKGLDVISIAYDPYNETDEDGDGDPHTVRTTTKVPRTEVVLPELEDMLRAMKSCTAGALSTCRSADREFRFGFAPGPGGELLLETLVVVERPPCHP